MSQKLNSISRFSPGNCGPDLLESMLVGRGELVDRLEKTVVDSVETGAGHNWLLIGPRGAGKTHILAILYNRIESNPEIRSRVVIAYMKEEERGVASFLDWLVRILRAFHRRGEKPPAGEDLDLGEGLESLKQLPLQQARTAAERLLLRFVGERRLLLIAENLGEIFDTTKGMGKEGQQRFRDLVQQHPFWTIVSSSQALFADIQDRDAPFYGFFKVQHLRRFDLEEAIALFKKLACLEGRADLQEFFTTEIGRGKARAVHQLTGGNPRLLVIFYQFLDRGSIEELASPFLEMVDSLTSYYQEQMQPLPALQQKIVEFLCEYRAPASVKEIARSCFITHQTASKQLGRLSERRYVIATALGRESFYELREPLFRICFEVKENLGYPIRLFVDFLGSFYSMEELRRKYRSARLLRSVYETGGLRAQIRRVDVELGYISQALSAYYSTRLEDIELEIAPLIRPERKTIETTVEELFSERDYREGVKLAEAAFDLKLGGTEFLLKSAKGHRVMGDLNGAREHLLRLVRLKPENWEAWIEKASIEKTAGDLDAAEESYRRALTVDERNEEALANLGVITGNRGELGEALRFFTQATEVAPKEPQLWLNLGIAQQKTSDVAAAQHSFERATNLAPGSTVAWTVRGRFVLSQRDHRTAIECFERVTHLRPNDSEGWRLLGFAQEKTGDTDAARQSYEKAIGLSPNSAIAWLYRGRFLGGQGSYRTALECFERVTQLRPDDGEGWRLLGIAQVKTGDTNAAQQSFERATQLERGRTAAWESRGMFLLGQDDHRTALECFERVTELRPDYGEGWLLLGFAKENTGDADAAQRSYERATQVAPGSADAWEHRGWLLGVQGKYGTALECFARVTELRPNYGEGWRLLGVAQERISNIDAAQQSYEKATELAPESVDAWESKGRFEWNHGEPSTALECFERVTALRPNEGEGWLLLGLAQENTGDAGAAQQSYKKATELDRDSAVPWEHRGRLLGGQGEYSAALECFEQVTNLLPDYGEGWRLLGIAHENTGDTDAAQQSYEKASELAPESPDVWESRGRFLGGQDEYSTALECFERVTKLRPEYGEGWRLLGLAQQSTDDTTVAQQSYRKATELAPESALAWKSRGALLGYQGEHRTARECFEQLTELSPDDGEGWLLLGLAQLNSGDTAGAQQSYEKATELASKDEVAWESRGRFLWEQGEHHTARECFARITELRPDYCEGWWLLGIAQEESGALGSAEASFERVTDLDGRRSVAWTRRAQLAARRGKRNVAREYLQRAEALQPESAGELNNRGETYRALGSYDEAIRCYRQALRLEPANCYANFNFALAVFESGDVVAGMKQMEAAAIASEDQDWSRSLPICITEINEHLLLQVEVDRLLELLSRQRQIFGNTPLQDSFFHGLSGALMQLLKKHAEAPTDRLRCLSDRVIPELAEVEELSVACRLFATGVSYLLSQDLRVLLKLAREERQSLEEILGSAS